VPVPAEVLLELLGGHLDPTPAPSIAPADLTVSDLARRFGRHGSTVRAWVERGLFPGAYRLQGREWRVPAAGLQAFEAGQRKCGTGQQGPKAGHPVDLAAWRGASLGTSRRQAKA
jgi:Helix-turn-helix domain